MNTEEISKIYDRLLSIKIEIDPVPSPDPYQLNTKIAQIHIFIDEVEKYYIRASKEISIIQRTLNDSTAAYESKKEEIISNNSEVKELPSIKDREARANQMVKDDRKKIKEYENSLNDLNNLLRAINLKLKNLNRVNGDVRNQIRVMEAQIRLGVPPINDPGARTLQEELSRSLLNKDSFGDSEARISTENIVDPSQPINTDEILENFDDGLESSEEESSDEDIPESYLDPLQEHGVIDDQEPVDLDEQTIEEVKKLPSEDQKINLDNIFNDQQKTEIEKKGGEAEKTQETKKEEEQKITKNPQKKDEINIDELLSQFS